MNIKSYKCPECGANIFIGEDQEIAFCSHCGTQLNVSPYDNQKRVKLEFGFNEKTKLEAMKREERKRREIRENEDADRKRREEKLEKKKISIWIFRLLRWSCVILFLVVNVFASDMISYEMEGRLVRGAFLFYIFFLIASVVNRFL